MKGQAARIGSFVSTQNIFASLKPGTLILTFSLREKGLLHTGDLLVGRDSVEPKRMSLQPARLDGVSPYQETRCLELPLPEGEGWGEGHWS